VELKLVPDLEVRELYKKSVSGWKDVHGVIESGHFKLSGSDERHTDKYFNKKALYSHTGLIDKLCKSIAEEFASDRIEVVAAPATGGCVLSNRIAAHLTELSHPTDVLALYADKVKDHVFRFGNTYREQISGKRVLIADDVCTSGETIEIMAKLVRDCGGIPVGIGVICNRGRFSPKFAARVQRSFALIGRDQINATVWTPEECQQTGPCSQNIPISTDLGHGSRVPDTEAALQEMKR
jgi:orotate phosphoribosyltransferase